MQAWQRGVKESQEKEAVNKGKDTRMESSGREPLRPFCAKNGVGRRATTCVALLLLVPFHVLSGEEVIAPLTAGEPLVLTFQQGRTKLAEGVLGFRNDAGKVFLPLEEVSRGVGFSITVDVANRRAEGFYISEENRFYLDLNQGTVESAGQSFEIEEGAVGVADVDFFVELSMLNKWLKNVVFAYNDSYLLVEVTSDPPLPVVQRFAREDVRSGLAATHTEQIRRDLQEVVADYKLFSLPVIDVDSNVRWSNTEGVSGSIGLRGAQDLAGMGARWFVGFDQDKKPREARITLSRKDPSGGLLGPLALTEIEIGDIGQFGTPLISRGLRGAGIRMTNRPRDVTSGTTIEVRGELPEGWEAELYRSDILIGFDVESEKGEYVFPDVSLQPGINELTVMRYGPQGQRDETSTTVRLGGNQPAPGTWYTEVSALLQQRETVSVEGLFDEDSDSRVGNPDLGEPAAEARFVLGLKPGLSVAASCTTMSLDGERTNFAGLSTEFSPFGIGLTVDAAFDQNGDWAAGGRMLAGIDGFGIFLQHEEFEKEFRSPVSGTDRQLKRRSQLRVNRRLELSDSGLPINIFFKTEYEHGVDTDPRVGFSLGTSTSIGEMQVSKQFTGTLAGNAGGWELTDLDGRLNLSLRRPVGTLRGGFSYSVAPRWRLGSVSLNGSTGLLDAKLRLNATFNHEFGGSSSIGLGLGWSLPRGELSTQLNYNTAGSVSAGVGMRFSLGWRNKKVLPRLERRSRASQGLAYVQVFLDNDNDGERSQGDEPLAGVRLTPGNRHEQTDDDGHILLSGFAELLPTDVVIKEATLPDPFMRPTVPGYRVTVRPGAPVDLSFPVVWVSDVEGMVLVTEETIRPDGSPLGPRTRGLGNVQVVVLDSDGQEVSRLRSEFDGFFAVPNLPSGRYKLRIDPDQAALFGLDDDGGTEVTLQDDTAILSGVELRLRSSKPFTVYNTQKGGEIDGAALLRTAQE